MFSSHCQSQFSVLWLLLHLYNKMINSLVQDTTGKLLMGTRRVWQNERGNSSTGAISYHCIDCGWVGKKGNKLRAPVFLWNSKRRETLKTESTFLSNVFYYNEVFWFKVSPYSLIIPCNSGASNGRTGKNTPCSLQISLENFCSIDSS